MAKRIGRPLKYEHEYFIGAEEVCDSCKHQVEKDGSLCCNYYGVTVLFFYPHCLRTGEGYK